MDKLNDQERRVIMAMISGEWMTVAEVCGAGGLQANSFHARCYYLKRKGYHIEHRHVPGGRGAKGYDVYRLAATPKRFVAPQGDGEGAAKESISQSRRSCPQCGVDEFFWKTFRGGKTHRCECGQMIKEEESHGKTIHGKFAAVGSSPDSSSDISISDDMRDDNNLFGVRLPWKGVVNG